MKLLQFTRRNPRVKQKTPAPSLSKERVRVHYTTRDVTFYDGFLVTFIDNIMNATTSMTFFVFGFLS